MTLRIALVAVAENVVAPLRDDAGFRADHARTTAVRAAGLLVASGAVVLLSSRPPLPSAVVPSQPVSLTLIAWTGGRFRTRAPELHEPADCTHVADTPAR